MTLIEVMVATVVIAIGLLGVAALQVSALQGASDADYRSKAIDFASALSDRMHANLAAFEGLDGTTDNNNPYIRDTAAETCPTEPVKECAMLLSETSIISKCTSTEIAKYDLWEIACKRGVKTSLPGGELDLTCLDGTTTCTGLSKMLITISWQSQSDDASSSKVKMTVIPGAP
jgi:type IV pilus assembly protein PilV